MRTVVPVLEVLSHFTWFAILWYKEFNFCKGRFISPLIIVLSFIYGSQLEPNQSNIVTSMLCCQLRAASQVLISAVMALLNYCVTFTLAVLHIKKSQQG